MKRFALFFLQVSNVSYIYYFQINKWKISPHIPHLIYSYSTIAKFQISWKYLVVLVARGLIIMCEGKNLIFILKLDLERGGHYGSKRIYKGIIVMMTPMTSFGKLVKSLLNHVRTCKRGFISYWRFHRFLFIPNMSNPM